MQSARKGFLAAFGALTCFAFTGLWVKASHWDPFLQSTVRTVFCTGVIFAVYRGRKDAFKFSFSLSGTVNALSLAFSTLLIVISLKWTTTANTFALLYLSVVLAPVISWLCFHERITLTEWLILTAAMTGTVLVFLSSNRTSSFAGDILGVLAACFWAFYLSGQRASKDKSMASATFWGTVISSVLGLTLFILFGTSPAEYAGSGGLAAIYGICSGTAYVLINCSLRYLSTGQVSLITAGQIVLAPLVVGLSFGEWPDLVAGAGLLIVSVAILVSVMRGLRSTGD